MTRSLYLMMASIATTVYHDMAYGFGGIQIPSPPYTTCGRKYSLQLRNNFITNHETTISDLELAEQQLLLRVQNQSLSLSETQGEIESSIQISQYQSVIERWLEANDPERAESLLNSMELYHSPSGRIYEKIIQAWCLQALDQAEKWRESLNRIGSISDKNRQYHSHDHDKHGIDAADKALALLNRLEQLYQATGDTDYRPALSTYSQLVNTFARVNKLSPAKENFESTSTERERLRAHAMSTIEQLRNRRDRIYNHPYEKKRMDIPTSEEDIYHMIRQYDGGADILLSLNYTKEKSSQNFLSTTKKCNKVIRTLTLSRRPWVGALSEAIFDYMVHRYSTTDAKTKPDIFTLNNCLYAWASASDMVPYAADRCEKLLVKLHHIQHVDIVPDKVSYNIIIKAYANMGNSIRADAILAMMESSYQATGNVKVRPDLISYSCVLHSYARASKSDVGAAKRAEDLLAQMYKQYKAGINPDIQPTTVLFNNVINAHAECGAGIRAMTLLMLMEDISTRDDGTTVSPNLITYNSVLKAIAKSIEEGAVNRAERLLQKMENSRIIQPDIISYNTFIDIIARSGGKGSGRKAEEVFMKLKELGLKANSATITSVINAWTQSGDKNSFRRSEDLLCCLMDQSLDSPKTVEIFPDTSIYNALIKCACINVSTEKALEILSYMEASGKNHIRPNQISYSTIIDSIACDGKPNADSCYRALEILDRMITRYNQGFLDVRPNCITYSTVIKCFAKSNVLDKAQKAFEILKRMEEDFRSGNTSARPSIISYNSVLNACAYSNKTFAEDAFRIACLIFDDIRTSDYLRPTHISFATYLRVIHNMMPDSDMKNDLIEGVIRRCSRDGLCSVLVMKQLVRTATPGLLSKLLTGETDIEKIPKYWSRNVMN